uniref:Uncharacterized protein n=1 Tax=Branchiostoma floridae TaxID=7739 RepID=C3Z509_BRAFL|eukprot:XP_002596354.1 hypothetical protein BRAFLDRAFT_76163 [Branchiostoma floridae]
MNGWAARFPPDWGGERSLPASAMVPKGEHQGIPYLTGPATDPRGSNSNLSDMSSVSGNIDRGRTYQWPVTPRYRPKFTQSQNTPTPGAPSWIAVCTYAVIAMHLDQPIPTAYVIRVLPTQSAGRGGYSISLQCPKLRLHATPLM